MIIYNLLHPGSAKKLRFHNRALSLLTIFVQPFICLHPAIMWSRQSVHFLPFILTCIYLWCAPLTMHLVFSPILYALNYNLKIEAFAKKALTVLLQLIQLAALVSSFIFLSLMEFRLEFADAEGSFIRYDTY